MAALEKIRSKGVIVMAIVFLALACFVIGDFLSNSSAIFNRNRDQIGEVYGKKMSYTDFQKDVDAFTYLNKIQGTFSTDANVRNEAWQTYVLSSVMNNQAEKIGMYVTPEEMEYATRTNPHAMIQNIRFLQDENGRFSKPMLERLLQTFKSMEDMSDDERNNNPNYENLDKLYNSWVCVEKKLGNMLLYDKYFRILAAATSAPKAEKNFIAQYNNEASDYVMAFKSFMQMPDSAITVSDAEAKAKYKELEKMFKTNAYRTIRAIVYDVKPMAADSDEAKSRVVSIEKELKAAANDDEAILLAIQECDPAIANRNVYLSKEDVDFSIRDFAFGAKKDSVLPTFEDGIYYKTAKLITAPVVRPDSVKISCIYLTQASKEELKQRADSIQNELKNGASFGELAEKHTMDTRSKSDKGNLGWFTEGQFSRLKDFDDKTFSAKLGEVIAIEDRGEYFLFKVDSISATSSPKVKIAEVAVKIESSSDTYRKYYESASKYLSENNTLEDFVNNAASQNLFVQEYSIQEDDNTIANIENARKIVNWAFNEKRKVGDVVAQPFEASNQCVIVALESVVEKGYAPYSVKEVKNIVDDVIKNEKKAAIIMEEWANKDIASLSTSLDTLRGVRFDSERIEPSILGVLSTLKADEQSAPFKTRAGVYTVKVLSKTPVNGEPIENRGRVLQNLYNQTFSVLMDKAEITDNRSIFF